MNFNIVPTGRFKKEAKRLSKKFPSLKAELAELNETLTNQPNIGTPLGNNSYKIRLAIRSKGKGKSGGGRVITYLLNENKEVYLLTGLNALVQAMPFKGKALASTNLTKFADGKYTKRKPYNASVACSFDLEYEVSL